MYNNPTIWQNGFLQNFSDQLKSLGKIGKIEIKHLHPVKSNSSILDSFLFENSFEDSLDRFYQEVTQIANKFNWHDRKANHRQQNLKRLTDDFSTLYNACRYTRSQSILFQLYQLIASIKEAIADLFKAGRKVIYKIRLLLKKAINKRDIRRNIRATIRPHFKNMSDCSGADNAVSFSTDVIIISLNNLLYETKQQCGYRSDRKMYKLYTAIAA